jgi:tetratricopeptide (TPR) repeat protein
VAFDQIRQFDAALALYLSLIREYPDWQEPYSLAVRLQLLRGQARDAVGLLEQQLAFAENATAYANLALARRMLGVAPTECLAIANRAVALDPRLALAYLHRGVLLVEIGQTSKARDDFARVLELEPGNEKAKAGLQSLQ